MGKHCEHGITPVTECYVCVSPTTGEDRRVVRTVARQRMLVDAPHILWVSGYVFLRDTGEVEAGDMFILISDLERLPEEP